MRVRYKKNHESTGFSSRFNAHGVGEVVLYFDEGDATSEFISELDVEIDGEWFGLADALSANLLITDNYNTHFFVPQTKEDRERGYTL